MLNNKKFRCFCFVVPFSCDLRFVTVLSLFPVLFRKHSIYHKHGDSVLHCHFYIEFSRLFTEQDFYKLFKMLNLNNVKVIGQLSNKHNRERFDYYVSTFVK